MIRAASLLVLALPLACPAWAGRSAGTVDISDRLGSWLAAQDGPEAAEWLVFDRMHDVDQLDGLRPERLQADMDRMALDFVSEVTERVLRSDIDDDGAVTREEFLEMNPATPLADLQADFRRYDPDGDGLTRREAVLQAERARAEAENAASPLHEIATWDLDGDRIATRPEIHEVLTALAPKIWPAR